MIPPPQISPAQLPLNQTPIRAGSAMDATAFEHIRRQMLLDYCKWDAQIGDITTLAPFPLLISRREWEHLALLAERLTAEVLQAEKEMIQSPRLLKQLGLPRNIRKRFERTGVENLTPAAARSMRFDFHFTTDGWQISEVNSDVPGGFTEASSFTHLMAGQFPNAVPAGNPVSSWAKAICDKVENGSTVALLSAPGYMEDHQIISYLARHLQKLGLNTCLANPRDVRWEAGRATLESDYFHGPVQAIVRFYQSEWLSNLPDSDNWFHFFTGGLTPVANPGIAMLAESKRFPLVWNELSSPMITWRQLLPESRSPNDAPWEEDDSWLVKTAFSNTGDTVSIRSRLNAKSWRKVVWDVYWHPGNWVAQKRFHIIPVETPLGPMHPCLGVYTIDGKAAGIYGRISPHSLINFEAIDVAVLVKEHTNDVNHE